MTNHTEMFADNIGEIVLTGALVRIDLVSLSATAKDAAGAPTRELRQRIVMPVDGFVHSFSLMVQVMQQLEKHGLVTRNAVPAGAPPVGNERAAGAIAATTTTAATTGMAAAATATVAVTGALAAGVKSPNFK